MRCWWAWVLHYAWGKVIVVTVQDDGVVIFDRTALRWLWPWPLTLSRRTLPIVKPLDYIPGVLQAHPSPPLPSFLPFLSIFLLSFPFAFPSLPLPLFLSSLTLSLSWLEGLGCLSSHSGSRQSVALNDIWCIEGKMFLMSHIHDCNSYKISYCIILHPDMSSKGMCLGTLHQPPPRAPFIYWTRPICT